MGDSSPAPWMDALHSSTALPAAHRQSQCTDAALQHCTAARCPLGLIGQRVQAGGQSNAADPAAGRWGQRAAALLGLEAMHAFVQICLSNLQFALVTALRCIAHKQRSRLRAIHQSPPRDMRENVKWCHRSMKSEGITSAPCDGGCFPHIREMAKQRRTAFITNKLKQTLS